MHQFVFCFHAALTFGIVKKKSNEYPTQIYERVRNKKNTILRDVLTKRKSDILAIAEIEGLYPFTYEGEKKKMMEEIYV